MEFVKNKEMYLIVQDTEFNRRYHNYKLGDVCDDSKKHNAKYVSFKKAKRKIFKSKREKKLVFMESLHEKVRKSVNPELPSRLESIILYDNLHDCIELAKKWKKNTGRSPLGLYKVVCEGKLHACATTPDEKKSAELARYAHIQGITRFWQGDKSAEVYEYFFEGRAQVAEVLGLDVIRKNGESIEGEARIEKVLDFGSEIKDNGFDMGSDILLNKADKQNKMSPKRGGKNQNSTEEEFAL